jgi:ATP-binding cassette subfamily B protein
VRNADLILVLDRGRIVARGTHEELIRESGIYAEIYDLQLRAGAAAQAPTTATKPAVPSADHSEGTQRQVRRAF